MSRSAPATSEDATAVTETYLPLQGVRVLDLSRLIVGALTTRQLADLGAEVVKVEDPKVGDYLRSVAPFLDGEGVWHHLLNRNKKSIALDVTDRRDIETIMQLIDVADVVVDVSRPGALEKLGIDFAEIRARRPDLVVCSISPFGQDGEWRMIPAHGLNMDSLGGATATVDDEEGIPRFVQLVYSGLSQEGPSMQAALAIMSALFGVERGHGGVWIDISCWDALIEMNRSAIAFRYVTGRDPRETEKYMWGAKHRIYRAKDEKLVFVGLIERKFWERFCRALDRDDLVSRWESDGELDYGGGDALERELETVLASKTAQEWTDFFVKHELPGSPVLDLGEVIESSQFATRAMLETDDGRTVPNLAGPIRWIDRGGERPGRHAAPPPDVGRDTDDVLAAWLPEA